MKKIKLTALIFGILTLMVLSVTGCSSGDNGEDIDSGGAETASTPSNVTAPEITQNVDSTIIFTSPVFNFTDPERKQKRIPKKHTCTALSANEPNISPPLEWEGLPEGVVSLALIMDSLEVEGGPRVHWVVWNIPPTVSSLDAGVEHVHMLPDGTTQGANGTGEVGYLGPCPPAIVSNFGAKGGPEYNVKQLEQYFFKLYALDTNLDLPPSTSKADLLSAMDGHILSLGELVGERQGKIVLKEH